MRAFTSLFAFLSLMFLATPLIVESQTSSSSFIPVTQTGYLWAPRSKSNVEFVTAPSARTFRYSNGVSTYPITLTNYFLLYGGESAQGGLNDVWVGAPAGNRWYWVAGTTPDYGAHPLKPETFSPWTNVGHCQDSLFRQYRAGGESGELKNDVWSSADGVTWTLASPGAEWSKRMFPNLITDYSNKLYLAGGITSNTANPRTDSNEVWQSTDGGQSWYEMPQTNPERTPGGRGVAILLSAGSVWSTEPVLIWMTGVDTAHNAPGQDDPVSYYQDVWASRDNGKTWAAVTLAATFGRRDDANAEITSGGLIVLAGGYAGTGTYEIYNDVWASANGGYSWGLCVKEAEWEDRRYHMTVLDNQGYLWIMGGGGNVQGYYDDVWKSTFSFSDTAAVAQRCKLSIPSCGTGLRCWPGEASTLVSTDGANVYCEACPYSFSTTASRLTTIFLVVFLIGFIITGGLLAYTYYKLRSAGAASPIPLPASAQAWWNKSTAGAVNGTTDSTTTGADQLYQPLRIRDAV